MLRCLSYSKCDAEWVAYKAITYNIIGFNRVGCLPKIVNLSRLDDGVGIVAIFQQHNTKWHDSVDCNSTSQHFREQRRGNLTLKTIHMSNKFTRQSVEEAPPTETCFFCGMPPAGGSTQCVDLSV